MTKIVQEFSGAIRNLLFIYGSLMVPESLRRSLAEPQRRVEFIPAFLENHHVGWGLPSWRPLVDSEGAAVDDLYLAWLVVEHTPDTQWSVPGAIINVTDADLKRIRWRERSYVEADVTANIRLANGSPWSGDHRVTTFRCPDEDHTPAPDGARVAVRKGYYEMITSALPQIHGQEVTIPEPSAVEDVFDSDTLSTAAWKSQAANDIIALDRSLQEVLLNADCTRIVGGERLLIPYVPRPKVLQRGVWHRVERVSETAVGLLAKAVAVMLDDQELQRAAGYEENDVRLAGLGLANNFSGRDPRSPNVPEICRVDLIVTDRGHICVVEINTDSPAGSFHLDVLAPWQLDNCISLGMGYLPEGLPDSVCDELVQTMQRHWYGYLEAMGAPRRPIHSAAILDMDIRGRPTSSEFREYQRRFAQSGIDAAILEPEDITYRKGNLVRREDGVQIDLVYKRLLFDDIMREKSNPSSSERYAGILALEQAYLDNTVCMAPTMLSRMAGNKLLFAIVKHPSFEERLKKVGLELTEAERQVIQHNTPDTLVWANGELEIRPDFHKEILDDPTPWVLKAVNSYGARDVHFGSMMDYPHTSFLEKYNRDYIVQREQPHGMMEVPVITGTQVSWEFKPFTLGCYVVRAEEGPRAVGMEAKVTSPPPVALNATGGGRTAVFPTAR